MISGIASLVGQIVKKGLGFQLTLLIIMVILTYIAYYLGKRGKVWEIRPLEGLEAIYEGIGRCAEMGRPVMVIPGISGLGDASTIAGLSVLGEVTKRGTEIGVSTLATASSTDTIMVIEAMMRNTYTAAGKQELYEPGKYVRWFGSDQFSYAVGASGYILAEKPGMLIQVGYFIAEIPAVAEAGARVGAIQVGGTLSSMDLIAMFADYIFIGEEIFAAAAAITQDRIQIATLAGQDWIRLLTIGILVVGIILMATGSKVIVDLLGM